MVLFLPQALMQERSICFRITYIHCGVSTTSLSLYVFYCFYSISIYLLLFLSMAAVFFHDQLLFIMERKVISPSIVTVTLYVIKSCTVIAFDWYQFQSLVYDVH